MFPQAVPSKAGRLFVCLALIAITLTGCAKTKEPLVPEPATFTESSLGDAKRLLPMLATDSASGDIAGLVFNGLVKYGKDLKVVADLAESWDIRRGGLEIVFHLRQGVKWHDGEPFTADDVVFTYRAVTDANTPTPYGDNYGPVNSVTAVDPYTVRVVYNEPFAPALEAWGMGIVPRHILEGQKIDDERFTRHPVGTGPYRFKEWLTGQKIVLEAYDEYFEGRPKLDRFVMRVIPDTATEFMELKAGGIDYMTLTPTQFDRQTDDAFFTRYFGKYHYPSFAYTYMSYNLKDPLFTDKRVRRALAHAVDKREIIKGVLFGYGTPCTGPFPPESWAFNNSVNDPEYDPSKARALLAEAGWKPGPDGILVKDGRPFKFTVLTNQGNTMRINTALILKERLRAVGVGIEVRSLEWQALLERMDNREFEALIIGWRLSRDPDLYDIWHSSKTGKREFNYIGYKNAEVDRLIMEGRREFDYARRQAIYHRLHAILADEQPYMFLYVPDELPILNRRFKGVEKTALGILYDFYFWDVPKDRALWYQ